MKLTSPMRLAKNIQAFWAVPLSGFGHTADEQPLPYIEYNGMALTPRFGGEEGSIESNNESLPLPKGILKNKWPLSQRIFNFFRRRTNIYWRNIFKSFTRKDKKFLFIEQLTYQQVEGGFKGDCPLVSFARSFAIKDEAITIKDTIIFKKSIDFFQFEYAMTPTLKCHSGCKKIKIDVNVEQNHYYPIQSSTGWSKVKCKKLNCVAFQKGQVLEVDYCYKVTQ